MRSAAEYKDLEAFFKSCDKDGETFVDVLKEHMGAPSDRSSAGVTRRIVSGKPDLVTPSKKFSSALSGFVRIHHGWHNNDYVWHIEHASIRRPWKVPIKRVIYAIAKTMHAALPDIEATIWPPQMDWELRMITFKALNLKHEWSFSEDMVEKINNTLFEVLNKMV